MTSVRVRHIAGPDGEGYTEVFIDGSYSRIQGRVHPAHAVQMVKNSRLVYKFKD